MRTRKFKTLRGWLDYLANRRCHTPERVYESIESLFAESLHVYYFTGIGTPDEKWHNDMAVLPWDEKYPIAHAIVNFHWPRKSGIERSRIASSMAKGEGELHYLNDFQVCILKENGKWTYKYCTCGLSGPNYDYCKRKYLQSI